MGKHGMNGETKSLREWARVSGLTHGTIRYRLDKGLTGEDLLKPSIR